MNMKIRNLIFAAFAAVIIACGCNPEDKPNGGEDNGDGIIAIADVADLAAGTEFTVKGTIMARYARGFMLSDGTDNLLVYENNDVSSHAIGSKVTVTGSKSSYGGQPQLASPSSIKVNGTEEVKYPEPKVYTSSNISELKSKKAATYVRYTGKLSVSGDYHNVMIGGAAIQGSIAYPDNDLISKLAPMNGKNIVVTGYHIAMTSSDKYASTMVVSVELAEGETPAQEAKGWLELPAKGNVGTASEHTYKSGGKRNYTAYYDTDTYSSLWVAYPLAKGHMGSLKRPENWSFAPDIDQDDQVDLTTRSYKEGHSRGHQIPNGDRNGISGMQNQTFYVINSTPQLQDKFNGTIWADLEGAIRNAVPQNDTLYIATGPVFKTVGGNETIEYTYAKNEPNKDVAIANYFFKVVLKVKRSGGYVTDAKAIGFWFEHKNYDQRNYSAYAVSVDAVEQKTGYDFFTNLPDGIEATAEQNSDWTAFKSF